MVAALAADCSSHGFSLCTCSQLIKKHLIRSIDDCTRTAAMEFCKTGACVNEGPSSLQLHNESRNVGSDTTLPYKYHNNVGPLDMSWGFPSSDIIEIEFSLPSDYYIGLGFSADGAGDTIAGWVSQGKVHVGDYWDAGNVEPVTDQSKGCKNDVEPVSGSYKDGVTTVRFRRKLATGDKGDCDALIVKGPMAIVYAWCDGEMCFDYTNGCKAYADGCIDMPHSPDAANFVTIDFSGNGFAMLENMLKTDLLV
eukprot:TRINITY_DN49231_c0_g1_i1.p1 TRINITY_DN49231_c0_g1~~TRINITY_DN49231_c0_g1_i1.p1  ORF type:complete len:285 (+),score=35.46 TRINITY_DN49231_c0_g1_i1:101-856(+)